MHTDQEVLEALRAHYDQDELAAVVDRVLRVPEAWIELHKPEFLEDVVASNPPRELTPAHLASLALGESLYSKLKLELTDGYKDRSRQTWEAASLGLTIKRDLVEAALLGLEFVRRFDSDDESALSVLEQSPAIWGAPISISWLASLDPERLLGELLDRNLTHAAIQVALSNLTAAEASGYLTRNADGSMPRLLQAIARGNELSLAQRLSPSDGIGADRLSRQLMQAISQQFSDHMAEAQSTLHQAWETASQASAWVADFTADQATVSGDLVTALEANRKALEILPNSSRRARTALSYLALDRPGEAIALVSSPDPSVEERIAGGLAQAKTTHSPELLTSALTQIEEIGEEVWFEHLVNGLVDANEWAAAVEAGRRWVESYPSSFRAQIGFARVLHEAGDAEAAADHAAIASALRPQSDQASAVQAEIAEQLGNHAKALDVGEDYDTLSEAIQADPRDAALRLRLAKYLREQGRNSEALEAAANAWELDEESVAASMEYAELLSTLGHSSRALDTLRKAALRQPLSWRIGLALAKTYERRGDFAQAAQLIRPLPDSAPPEAYFHKARILLHSETKVDLALKCLEIAEARGWAEPSLDYWFARALERQGRYQDALGRYKLAERAEDYEMREDAVLGVARSEVALGQTSSAIAALEAAQQQYPRSAHILAALSDTYRAAKLPEKAREVAEQAVEMEPEEASAWRALGDSLAEAGDFRGAVAAIERLSTLDPAATEGWLTLAKLASNAQDKRTFRTSVAEALWRGRRNPRALQEAAKVLEEAQSLRSAERVIKAASRASPEDVQILAALANVQESAGDYEAALKTWQACVAVSPTEPEPLRRSAMCASKLGLGSQSVGLLEKAAAIEPGNPALRRELAKAHIEQGEVVRGIQAYAAAAKAVPRDGSLNCEAAEAALLASDARSALALLGKMDSALAESGRAHAATGEGFLLLDKRDRAGTALLQAIESGYQSARVFAMLAILASSRGEAIEQLKQARALSVSSAHEAVWLARAESTLLNSWAAIDALEAWQADLFALQEMARVTLRARDTHWLFQLADGEGPVQEEELTARLNDVMEALEQRSFVSPALEAWHRVSEDVHTPLEYIDTEPLGWLGEAVALANLKAHRLESARAALDQVRLIHSRSEWGAILDGLVHEADGQSDDARAAYRGSGPAAPIAEYLLGRAYSRAGILERAATHIGAAVIDLPEQHAWQFKLGTIYLESGDVDSALAHFQDAAQSDPENGDYLFAVAAAYAASGHLNQALEGYTAAIASGADSSEKYREAGAIALQLAAWDQALAWYERAITISPGDVESLVGSSQALAARGDHPIARERIGAALLQAPDDPRALLGLGHVRAWSGDHRAALAAFERALERGADPAEVRRGEGRVLVQQGKHDQAAEAMREALRTAPDDHDLWHELAKTLEEGSDFDGAEQAIAEAIRVSPASPEYHLTLARVSRKSGQLDRAIEELRQAEVADPADARVPIEAGLVYEARRDYTRALDSYLKALELDPESLQANYRAGLLLRTLKAYRKAGEMLRRAAELAPANQEVMHQLAAVRALELVHG